MNTMYVHACLQIVACLRFFLLFSRSVHAVIADQYAWRHVERVFVLAVPIK